jgi:hypothetical protein
MTDSVLPKCSTKLKDSVACKAVVTEAPTIADMIAPTDAPLSEPVEAPSLEPDATTLPLQDESTSIEPLFDMGSTAPSQEGTPDEEPFSGSFHLGRPILLWLTVAFFFVFAPC